MCVEIETAWTIQLSKHSTYHQRKVFGERVETLVRNEAVRRVVRTIATQGGKGPTMSSREIAELTGKDHDNVRHDIKNMADQLSPSFGEKTESSTGGRPAKVFMLPKRETLILVFGRQQLDRSLTTP